MSAHTPGPWQAPYKLKTLWCIYSADGTPIAKTTRGADASLIAAAPELLAALRAIRIATPLMSGNLGAVVDAAIAKAEGRE